MTIIAVTGIPLAGKSTISKKLAERLSYPRISSGDIVRKAFSNSDETKKALSAGALDPHESYIRAEVQSEINSADGNIVLDGFPRWNEQLKWMIEQNCAPQFLLIMKISMVDALIRASKRSREDDNMDLVRKRVIEGIMLNDGLIYLASGYYTNVADDTARNLLSGPKLATYYTISGEIERLNCTMFTLI